ncbi:MAG: 6-bladed beta-propeller [Nitrospirota bacterium]
MKKGFIIIFINLLLFAIAADTFSAEKANEPLEKGKKYYEDSEFIKAIEELRKAVDLLERTSKERSRNNDLIDAHIHLGLAYVGVNETEKAKFQFKEALRLDPEKKLNEDFYAPKVIKLFNKAKDEVKQEIKEGKIKVAAKEPETEKPAPTPSQPAVQTTSTSQPTFIKSWGKKGDKPGELKSPQRIAVGPDNLIYVADTSNHRIQVFDSEGNLIKGWGKKGDKDNEMEKPHGIAVGSDGAVYVSDNENKRILKFDRNGNLLAKFGNKNTLSSDMMGIAVDSRGNVYVADKDKNSIIVFNQKGEVIKTIGKKGKERGDFKDPSDIAIDVSGNIYVIDWGNKRIQKLDSNGNSLLAFAKEKELDEPTGLGLAKNGNVYLADKELKRIVVYDSTGRLIGGWGRERKKKQDERERFDEPSDVAVDSAGNAYILDVNEHRILKFRVN